MMPSSSPSAHAALALTLVAALAAPAAAQTRATTAELTGLVRDESGAVVPGAIVAAVNTGTNARRVAVTDLAGRFLLVALPPGVYDVSAELSGFAIERREGVVLALGAQLALDFTLSVAGVAEQVVVEGESPLADVSRTSLSASVSQEQIGRLPIDIRNFISFAVITPGVTVDRTPQQGAAATSGLTFAGQRARSNNITVDGLDNNDLDTGGVRATFSQEAVQEFQVLTNAFSAEFGKASGGVVNIVTRSGTNRHTGDAFLFVRDESLNAKEHFERFAPDGTAVDRPKAPYGQTQGGGVLGGPIRRDRAFYFLSFERLDIEANNFVTIDDAEIVTLFGQPVGTAADIFERAGFPVETGNVPYRIESDQFLAKIDQHLSDASTLGIRVNTADILDENVEPWGGQVARSRGALIDNRDTMVAGSYVSILAGTAVNDLRAQWAYRDQSVEALDPACDGACDRFDEGGPTVEVSGVGNVGRQRFTPVPKTVNRLQIVETFSYIAGDHYTRSGFDFSRVATDGALPAHFGGRYIFAPLPAIPGVLPAPITAIQAMALNLPAVYVQGYGTATTQYTVSDLSLFIQDDWRMRSNLTLKLGLRYQRQFWPGREYEATGLSAYSLPSDGNNLAPRVAVAWDPAADGRTSVHAAYGVYYDNHITSLLAVSNLLNGAADGIRTQVLRFPTSIAAWNAPGRQVPEGIAGPFPSLVVLPDPELDTPFAHHVAVGINRELTRQLAFSANVVYVKGENQLGTLDYNPVVPALGTGRRPDDVGGVPGTSTSVLQYMTFGETWYTGLTLSLERRLHDGLQVLVSYTLSKAEDNSTDFQSSFIPERTGAGRDPANPTGLPRGFDPDSERGPSVQDQRHRLVMSGLYLAPGGFAVSAIITAASGRPYNVLAGVDLDGNGDGGAFPADRARTNPADPTSSVSRNSGTLPAQATVDLRVSRTFDLGGPARLEAMLDVFNLFNRTNYTDVNNVFGAGAYPSSPLPTFGQFEKATPPRQVQIGLRLRF